MTNSRREFTSSVFGLGAGLAPEPARPASPVNLFNVREQGAAGDPARLETEIIQRVIDQCSAIGGGVVYFPPGGYLTGTLQIKSNVTLYLEAGAVIWGSKNPAHYRGEYLLYAEDAVNVAIRGRGAIDGNSTAFWKRKGNHWVAGDWRPWCVLRFLRCQDLLIEDVTVRNCPMWAIHPIDCDRMVIHGVTILNDIEENHGPNTDGIDPDGCSRVRISDCYIQSGDDSIVLKCMSAKSGACRDIAVTNCVLITHETALKIGSNSNGEFHNITFSNCAIRDAGCGIGLWLRPGGLVDGWTVSNISMTLTGGGQPIYFWLGPTADGVPPGTLRNVMISNVTATGDGAVFLSGLPEKHIQGVTLDNIRLHMRGGLEKRLHSNPPVPFEIWSHRLSPYDIFCRHVDNLTLRNIQLTWNVPESSSWGSAIRCQDINGLDLDGFVGRQALGSEDAVVRLTRVKNAFVRNCRALEGAGAFLRVEAGSENVTLMNNDLSRASQTVSLAGSVSPKELFESGNRPPRS